MILTLGEVPQEACEALVRVLEAQGMGDFDIMNVNDEYASDLPKRFVTEVVVQFGYYPSTEYLETEVGKMKANYLRYNFPPIRQRDVVAVLYQSSSEDDGRELRWPWLVDKLDPNVPTYMVSSEGLGKIVQIEALPSER